ncbi:MAG: hypothetical protein ACK4IT_09365 [Thioalkalivibrionaceae bacterium]
MPQGVRLVLHFERLRHALVHFARRSLFVGSVPALLVWAGDDVLQALGPSAQRRRRVSAVVYLTLA